MLGARSKLTAVGAAITLSLSLTSVSAAQTSGAASASTSCISDNGTNVNAYFGIEGSDAIWLNLQGLQPACRTVIKGNTFYRVTGWITQVPPGTREGNKRIKPVYPVGYRPDFPAPMDDFLSKLSRERFVISNGGAPITITVTTPDLLTHGKLGAFGDLFVAPDTALVPGVTIFGDSPEWTTVEPLDSQMLSVGQHAIDVYWTLTKQHCDGFTRDVSLSCLPAGETLVTSTTFEVIPR
jgi:hypothetical protein